MTTQTNPDVASDEQAEPGPQYVIARSNMAGCFAGYLPAGRQLGDEQGFTAVTLYQARRLWYWAGAATLSQLATTGTSKPGQCKFPAPVEVVELPDVCEVLAVTDAARESIAEVPAWSA